MDTYELFYRNEAGEADGQIIAFEKLVLKPNYNAVGSWTLTAPVAVLRQLVWKGGLIVKRNGKIFFSGNVNRFYRKRDLTTSPITNTLECTGEDDHGYLLDRLALPVPGGPPYTGAEFDVRSGCFETVAKEYVSYNLGPDANLDRQIEGLTIEEDYARGGEVSGSARFDLLDNLLESLAINAGGIGYRIVNKVFQVYEIGDKTKSIILSEDLGNLSAFEYTLQRPKTNYVYLGGSGDGTARIIQEGLDSASIIDFGRIESFTDNSSLSDSGEMDTKINEVLEKKGATLSLKLTPISLPNMNPIDDYWLGDTITAIIDGEVVQSKITSAEINVTRTKVTVQPILGGLEPDAFSAMYADIRDVNGRVSSLERN